VRPYSKNENKRARGVVQVQVVEYQPSKWKTLISNPSTIKRRKKNININAGPSSSPFLLLAYRWVETWCLAKSAVPL
jgi:hypothetical protein